MSQTDKKDKIKEGKEKDKNKDKDKLRIDRKRLESAYALVTDFQQRSHARNQKRIKIGLRCLYIIPAVFLFLLMVTGSSKIIFLALWIISLFGLAIYLIAVEYMDYNLQKQINRLKGEVQAPVDGLIEMDRFEETVDRLESRADRYEAVAEHIMKGERK